MKEQQYKQFFKDYEKSMTGRTQLHSRKVLREDIIKKNELSRLEEEAEKERQKKLKEKDIKDQYYHQKMLQDAKLHNKSMLDFKQRLQQQQKMEKIVQENEQRLRENNEMKLLKIKQGQDLLTNKKQYYDDLKKQKVDKVIQPDRLLDKNDYSVKASTGLNAMIPGINNWNTIGSVPLKRGAQSLTRSQISLDPPMMVDRPIELPNIASARHSKYKIMKELETEQFNETNGLKKGFVSRRLSHNQNYSQPNLHDINPYIEKEKSKMASDIKQRNHSLRF